MPRSHPLHIVTSLSQLCCPFHCLRSLAPLTVTLRTVLLVVKMRRDTRDVDVNFDTQSYDPRPSRANKFGRWATFDTNDNDGVSYNYETESDGGNSKFGARGMLDLGLILTKRLSAF